MSVPADYPLSSACSLRVHSIPDSDQAQLRAWQLSLRSDGLSEYSFPGDIGPNFFALVWVGSIRANAPIQCIADYDFFWISEGTKVMLESESAELAILGITDADPAFDPALDDRNSMTLPSPPMHNADLTATIISLNLWSPGTPVEKDDWVRPSIVLTSSNGPNPIGFDAQDNEVELPRQGVDPVFVSVPGNVSLMFEDGTQQRAVVCDFAVEGDALGGVGCTWRCPGK